MTNPDSDAARCATHLRRAVSVLARRLRPSLQGDGISVAKLSVIGWLQRERSLTPTELAAREGVKLQSLTRMLAELEADGWLVRGLHASDGRQTLLSLTAEGEKRLLAAARAEDASLAQVIAGTLTADQRAVLLQACALIDGLADAMGPASDASAPAPRPPGRRRS